MSKPDHIPQDIWDTVERSIWYGMDTRVAGLRMAEAIMAEREACAQAVSDWRDLDGSTGEQYDDGYSDAILDAISAIRNRKEA